MRAVKTSQVLGLLLLHIIQITSTNESSTSQACRFIRSRTSKDLDVHCLLETPGTLTTEFVPQNLRKRVVSIHLHIHNDTFQLTYAHLRNLSALRTLIIYGRQPNRFSTTLVGLTKIQPMAFRDCQQLRQLLLKSNRITSLEKDVFYGLSNLLMLDLIGNPIKRLDPLAFEPLSNRLQMLSYKQPMHDAISQRHGLHSGFLNNFTVLEVLNIFIRPDDNYVPYMTVKAGAITSMPKLRILSIVSDTRLFIESGALKDLPALEEIHLTVIGVLKLEADVLQSSSVEKRAEGVRWLKITSLRPVEGLLFNPALFQCTFCGEQRFSLSGMSDRLQVIHPKVLKLEDNFPAKINFNITSLSVTLSLYEQISRELLQRMPMLTYLQINGEPQAFNMERYISHQAELARQKGLPMDFRLYGLRSLSTSPVSLTNKLLKQVKLAVINCTCQALRDLEVWMTADTRSRSVSLRCRNFHSTENNDDQTHCQRDHLINLTYFANICSESEGPDINVYLTCRKSLVQLAVTVRVHIFNCLFVSACAWLINRSLILL